jgi:putative hydrolase of the HAD superfamily
VTGIDPLDDDVRDEDVVDPSGESGAAPEPRPDDGRERPQPKVLVIDVGGVLVPPSMPVILHEVAMISPRSERQLKRFFNHELREDFWGGRLSERDFWVRLFEFAGTPDQDIGHWRDRLPEILEPLPAVYRVCDWAARIRTVLMSNHRHEWCIPQLARHGVTECVTEIMISSQTGLVKPAPEAFLPLLRLGVPPEEVLFIDDRPNNVNTAADLGVQTVFAGEEDHWIAEVDRRIGPAWSTGQG